MDDLELMESIKTLTELQKETNSTVVDELHKLEKRVEVLEDMMIKLSNVITIVKSENEQLAHGFNDIRKVCDDLSQRKDV